MQSVTRFVGAPCVVPFCGGIVAAPAGDEVLCGRHWCRAAGPLRARYEAAWEQATEADKAGGASQEIADRVTKAWAALKAYVIEAEL